MGRIRMTPEEYATKQATNLKNSIPYMKAGIQAVTESPGIKAAQKIEKMRTNFNAAIDSGKTKRALESINLEDWKGAMINKGLTRIASGIDAAKPKVVKFAKALFDYQNTVLAEIDTMPDLTLEDSIARMTHMVRRMKDFSYTK